MTTKKLVSDVLATFVAEQSFDAIPEIVRGRAKLLLLDAIGNAYASTRLEFAHKALTALRGLGSGNSNVIGMPTLLGLRDAAMMNSMLVHGGDFDETYLPGSVHMTASCVPTALAVAADAGASGKDLLLALILGLEVAARLGAAGKGGFNLAGFHATNLIGIFGCTMIAGRLMQLGQAKLVMAQGISLSMAAGTHQPLEEGSWTKRMHPGFAAASAITAVALARQGFIGPTETYEGKYGLYPCFLGAHAANVDLDLATSDLAKRWEFTRSSVKLYPACHQTHALIKAAIKLRRTPGFDVANIESIRGLVSEAAVPLICEPLATKLKPPSNYAAQFSMHYTIACGLVRGQMSNEELDESSYSSAELLEVASKVKYEVDPNGGFPKTRTGEVIIRMKNGQVLSQREEIGPDQPEPEEDILAKFMLNTKPHLLPARASALRDIVMDIENFADVGALGRMLGGTGRN